MVVPASSVSPLAAQFAKFSVAGGIGFFVEAVVLTLLVNGLGWDPYLSRVASFTVAVTATWLINRRYAFRAGASGRKDAEYARYFLVQTVGVTINFAVYVAAIRLFPELARFPVIPLALGSGVALFANFVGMRIFVFRG